MIVWDNHGRSLNLDYTQLDPRCEDARAFTRRFPGLEADFDAVALLGYHAWTTPSTPCSRTRSHRGLFAHLINGEEAGELRIDAAIAGEIGVPVLGMAACDKACQEAAAFLDGLETVVTKRSFDRNGHQQVRLRLHGHRRDGATHLRLASRPQPYTVAGPIEHRVECKRMEAATRSSSRAGSKSTPTLCSGIGLHARVRRWPGTNISTRPSTGPSDRPGSG